MMRNLCSRGWCARNPKSPKPYLNPLLFYLLLGSRYSEALTPKARNAQSHGCNLRRNGSRGRVGTGFERDGGIPNILIEGSGFIHYFVNALPGLCAKSGWACAVRGTSYFFLRVVNYDPLQNT